MTVNRIALGIRYDGARYHGWQSQDGDLLTVQQTAESAVSRVADHPVSLVCAGRTDAGVHASAQVVHFDSDAERTDYSWMFGTNRNLPPDISIIWAKFVPKTFHARFSATSRRYRYVIYNHQVRPAILRHAVGWYHKQLDEGAMQKAANYLLGEHDFTSFRGSKCQANTAVRHIIRFDVSRQRRMIIVEVEANAFLLHMVRNLVGVLFAVGSGERHPEWAKEVLEAQDRRKASVTVSPNGLYFVKAEYPEVFELPENPIGPFFLP